jgi:hypothetical protein
MYYTGAPIAELIATALLCLIVAGLAIWIHIGQRFKRTDRVSVELCSFSFTNWLNTHPTRSNLLWVPCHDTPFYVYAFENFAVLDTRERADLVTDRNLVFAVKTNLEGNTWRLDDNAPILPQLAYTYQEPLK